MTVMKDIFQGLGLKVDNSVPEIKVSTGVRDGVTRAIGEGMPPEEVGSVIINAAITAKREGRTKLGMFGKGGETLGHLTGKAKETRITNFRRNILERK